MSFKDILAPILSVSADEPVLAAAEVVAEQQSGRITPLLVGIEPDPVYTMEGAVVIGVWAEVLARGAAARCPHLDLRVGAVRIRSSGLIGAARVAQGRDRTQHRGGVERQARGRAGSGRCASLP
jgi:hypothetical protein